MEYDEWFRVKFLPSVFEKAGIEKYFWLSGNQSKICLMYMEQYSSFGYKCDWQGRTVTFDYNKKNGCGVVKFSMTSEEAEKASKIWQDRQLEREYQFALRMAKRPERIDKEIEYVRQAYEDVVEDIEAGFTDYINLEAAERFKTKLNLLLKAKDEVRSLRNDG